MPGKNKIIDKLQMLMSVPIISLIIYLSFIFFDGQNIQAATISDAQQLLNENATAIINNSISKQTNNLLPESISTIYKSGVNGTANWDIDSNGLLTIHPGKLMFGTGNWSPYANSIKSVYVEKGVEVNSDSLSASGANSVFSELPNVTTIDVTNLDVSNAGQLGSMFEKDPKLEQIIGLETWDTAKCSWLSSMFYNDSSLKELNLSSFSTNEVESMSSMFMNCSSLEKLDLSNFDTSNVLYMNNMFLGVPGKIEGLKNFDVSNVTNLASVFKQTDFTKNDPADIADWDVSKVTDMSSLFEKTKFNELDLSKWNTNNVTDISYSFAYDSNINEVKGLSDWNTSNVTKFVCTFQNVTDTDISVTQKWDVSNSNSFVGMFSGCTNLEKLDLSNFKAKNAEKFSNMFSNDKLLNEDNLIGYKTLVNNKATLINGMYQGTGFETIDLSNYDTSNVTSFASLFDGTKKLKQIIGSFDTSSATDFSKMFNGSNIVDFEGLNIADWNTSKVTNLSNTFSMTKISDFDFLKDWNTSSVTNLSGTFQNTTAKDISAIKDWDVSQVTNFGYIFQKNYFEALPIENWDVSNAVNMQGMFFYSYLLKHLDLSKWDPSKCTNFYAIFNTMTELETLDISGFDTTQATDLNYFLGGDPSLWKITLGPKVLMKEEGTGLNVGTNFPIPKPGTIINGTSYKAISDKWQEVDEKAGGTDHQPVGELLSSSEIVDKYLTTGNPITTYVWQQQPKIDISMTVPDIDFGTINSGQQVVQRKNKDYSIEINNNNYPSENVQSTIMVSFDKPLTSLNSLNTLENVLMYREKNKADQIISNLPIVVYEGNIPGGSSSIDWDEESGILMNMKNEPHPVNGNYETTLNWTMTNSL